MPLKWVPPELVVPETETTPAVYQGYKDNDASRPLDYWFTTDVCEEDDHEFDIREFPEYDPKKTPIENVVAALEDGWITFPETT